MERQRVNCLRHDRNNEIFCNACKSFLCSKCITDHTADGHSPAYIHILDYSPKEVLPKFDAAIAEMKKEQKQVVQDLKDLLYSLHLKLPVLIDRVNLQEKKCNELMKSVKELKVYSNQSLKTDGTSTASSSIAYNRKRLESAIAKKNVETVLSLAIRTEAEALQSTQSIADLAAEMNSGICSLNAMTAYDDCLTAAELVMSKCISLKPLKPTSTWQCDGKYLTPFMYLSKDGLTFGGTKSKKYAGIVGTLVLEKGMFVFAVIPKGLDCAGKEGFGIIEESLYLKAYKANSNCPEVHKDMIGYMYKGEARNMHADLLADMQMGETYYVRVNLIDYNLSITGPGLSLSEELMPGLKYYPCFSCGCSNNRLLIVPLTNYDDVLV
eukprot:TRINITY_DN380_c0_g4_i1.p1 TRINITY_DN380_c0_g4~~TRINITY_DN380_c0_g4_i1.p1  ORF type:complete len:381 (-),score=106.27 TRINITY_DN380_c0_g4_i1:112-1254(-)